jgi:hypothetical protein
MLRYLALVVLLCLVSAAIAAPTVIVNGTPSAVAATDIDGKAYVDAIALMKLLGGKASYDAATGKIYVNGKGAPAASSKNQAAFGTPQLPGDNGEIGQVYKLRTGNPVYFRLNSAEYTVARIRFSKSLVIPEADEKLLVIHFSVQNPDKDQEMLFRFDSLKFTAVDAMNVNHDHKFIGDEQTKESLQMHLKPAQRVEAYTCIVVPASAEIPKLMVMPPLTNDGPVLRYDLRDKVAALPAPVADPADPSGATALKTVPAQLNTSYPMRFFDVAVEKTEAAATAPDGSSSKPGDSYFVVTMACKNTAELDSNLRFDTLALTLTDADGQQLKRGRDLLAATSSSSFNQKVPPGAEAHVRYYFIVPKDAKPNTLAIREATSRTYEWDVSQ